MNPFRLFSSAAQPSGHKHRFDGKRDRYGRGSKLSGIVLLCPWQRHFAAFYFAFGGSYKTVLNFSHISK